MIRVGIITAPREGRAFMLDTLEAAVRCAGVADCEFRVFADALPEGSDAEGLELFSFLPVMPRADRIENEGSNATTPMVPVIYRTQAELDEIKSRGYYGTWNLCRALDWASSAELAVTLEDDLGFAERWLAEAVELFGAWRYTQRSMVLSLHHMLREAELDSSFSQIRSYAGALRSVCLPIAVPVGEQTLAAWETGTNGDRFPNRWAWGSQAYLMRGATASVVAQALMAKLRAGTASVEDRYARRAWCMDVGMWNLWSSSVIWLGFCDPTLVLHRGDRSSTWADPATRSVFSNATTYRFSPF